MAAEEEAAAEEEELLLPTSADRSPCPGAMPGGRLLGRPFAAKGTEQDDDDEVSYSTCWALLAPVLGISGPEASAAFKLAAKAGVIHADAVLLLLPLLLLLFMLATLVVAVVVAAAAAAALITLFMPIDNKAALDSAGLGGALLL